MEASPGFEYCALSYVWGDETTTREILLQDIETNQRYLQPLHENLWLLLRQIWKHSRAEYEARRTETAPLLVWTDALCLNQEDEQEKSQQIPRMGTIYSQAKVVLVWLGTDEKLQSELKRLRDCGENVGFYEALSIPGLDATHQNASCKLATDPYWRRTWVVQEIVLARRPLVMAGDIIMEFSRLERQLLLNDATGRGLNPKPPTVGWNWLEQIIDLRAAERNGTRMPLWRIIKCLWLYEKSRVADGIYGILGLVGDHPDGTSPKEHIAVDYDKSAVEIFFDTIFETRAPIVQYPTLLEELNFILRDNNDNRPLDTYFPLEQYFMGNTTSDRHKKLAATAARVNEATRLLLRVTDPFPGHRINRDDASSSKKVSHNFETSLSQPDAEKVTLSHHAAVVGFLLEFVRDGPGQDKNHRVDGPSPWRCAVHRAQQHYPTPEYIGVWKARSYISSSTDLVALCGEQCDSCDVSELVFEISETGFQFRLNVKESTNPVWKDARLSIGVFDPVTYDNR
ncbi:hypothetical protein LA080_015862 [Diaporthe eres]|nr:hypothetical protein LA080_015862 [Diaporthe eres]